MSPSHCHRRVTSLSLAYTSTCLRNIVCFAMFLISYLPKLKTAVFGLSLDVVLGILCAKTTLYHRYKQDLSAI